jgi:hypothetical protein
MLPDRAYSLTTKRTRKNTPEINYLSMNTLFEERMEMKLELELKFLIIEAHTKEMMS